MAPKVYTTLFRTRAKTCIVRDRSSGGLFNFAVLAPRFEWSVLRATYRQCFQ
jgi:hypothetical protein